MLAISARFVRPDFLVWLKLQLIVQITKGLYFPQRPILTPLVAMMRHPNM